MAHPIAMMAALSSWVNSEKTGFIISSNKRYNLHEAFQQEAWTSLAVSYIGMKYKMTVIIHTSLYTCFVKAVFYIIVGEQQGAIIEITVRHEITENHLSL